MSPEEGCMTGLGTLPTSGAVPAGNQCRTPAGERGTGTRARARDPDPGVKPTTRAHRRRHIFQIDGAQYGSTPASTSTHDRSRPHPILLLRAVAPAVTQ